jgi:hypothetical protein
VYYDDLVSSPGGNALLVYGIGTDIQDTNLVVRWSRRGRPFGAPADLTPHTDPFSVGIEAVPGGRFAVRWIDRAGTLHLARASAARRPFREVASWTPPGSANFRRLLPLADGRTLLAWATQDRIGAEPDRLLAAVIDARGKIGPEQTIATAPQYRLDGFQLRRLGANRAALVWTESGPVKKRVRIALMPR